MNTLGKITTGMFLACAVITTLTITPGRASTIQPTGGQLLQSEKSIPVARPATKYGTKLNERNAAAKQQTVSKKAVKPKQVKDVNNKKVTDKRQLSKRNQAVIEQAEAAKQKRMLIEKNNAGDSQNK